MFRLGTSPTLMRATSFIALMSTTETKFDAAQATYAPRIIVVTAVYRHIRYQNEARLKYGIDHYLTKPVSREALAAALME